MDETSANRLLDAYLACGEIKEFAKDHDLESFLSNRGLRLIIERLLEIVGEALREARRIEPGLQNAIPDLSRIVATRHRIAHGYDSLDNETIWVIVEHRIDDLQARLRLLLVERGHDLG